MMHLKQLKKKTPAELVEMAEELGVEGASTLRKQDIMFAILKVVAENGDRNDLVSAQANEHTRQRAPEVSVFAQRAKNQRGRRGVVHGHHIHSDAAGACLLVRCHGLAHALCAWLGGLQHDGLGIDKRGTGKCRQKLPEVAGDIQHRSRQPVHIAGVGRKAGRFVYKSEHGREGSLDG